VAALSEHDPHMLYPEDDPLVRRLRTMSWVPAGVEISDRCWEGLCDQIEELDANASPPPPIPIRREDRRLRSDEWHHFTRVTAPRRPAVAQAWHRPAHTVALAG
jgi:hypothetical protein